MLLKLLLLLAPFTIALETRPDTNVLRADARVIVDDPDDSSDEFTGAFGGVTFDHDGWAWFSLGDRLFRMKTVNFPNPVPYPGTVMTATGVTDDPYNPGTYICTGLQ